MGCNQSKTFGSGIAMDAKYIDKTMNLNNPSKSSSRRKPTPKEAAVVGSKKTLQEKVIPEGRPVVSDAVVETTTTTSAVLHRRYSSGASTPEEQTTTLSHGITTTGQNPKIMVHSSSVLGLDKLLEDRRAEGDLKNNIVHIEVPFGKPIEEVYDGIHDGPVLGSGISGLVRLCTHKATGAKYAVKSLDLGLVETDEGLQQLREEIAIMCQLDHPNIVRLEEVYESLSEIYLVQELCLGGELFDRLDEQPDYHYTEKQCARLVKQMLCSVRYIHSKGIIHRDLKLENFLFSNTSPDSELKMIDFGLSKHFKFGEVQHEAVGTPYTVAPEVIRGSYDERCDVWAIGVITYLLLSGDPPFGGCGGPEPLMQVRANILRGKFSFQPPEIWDNVSTQAKDFIRMLLVTDPNQRPTARECQKSPWLQEWAHSEQPDKLLNPNVVKALVAFKEYSDMRKLLCEVLSFTLMPDQITDLRKEFEKLDTDGSGEISLSGLKKVLMVNAGAGSLGALTEEEVEDIFNAMRVRKTETRIHWHEFIAAGLSQCKVDERNLRLAFDRLDSDHKGYITFENVMDLMGSDAADSEDAMRRMWVDSMAACKCHNARITYEDFLLLMKGQTKEDPKTRQCPKTIVPSVLLPPLSGSLGVVHEGVPSADSATDENDENLITGSLTLLTEPVGAVLPGVKCDKLVLSSVGSGVDKFNTSSSAAKILSSSPPGLFKKTVLMQDTGPIILEDDDDLDEAISQNADKAMKIKLDRVGSTDHYDDFGYNCSPSAGNGAQLTPPQTPVRSATDYITPMSQRKFVLPENLAGAFRALSALPVSSDFTRRRSRSVDDQDQDDDAASRDDPEKDQPLFTPDVRRAMLLPEHDRNQRHIENLIKDETKTPLVVNRQLYRAHRQMRLAVLEASKRFEEEQIRRTKESLRAQREAEGTKGRFAAGLVMRHGHSKELSSESVRLLMREWQKQQHSLMEKANKRGGRGRKTRKKTTSDMSGMLSSVPPEELSAIGTPSPSVAQSQRNLNDDEDTPPTEADDVFLTPSSTRFTTPELHLRDTVQRKPTVPGQFRKTSDPFSQVGGSMMKMGYRVSPAITERMHMSMPLPTDFDPSSSLGDSSVNFSMSSTQLSDNNLQNANLSTERREANTQDDFIGGAWPPPLPL